MKEERLLTTSQVAYICSVTAETILKWIRSGYLPAEWLAGARHRITQKDLSTLTGKRRRENSLIRNSQQIQLFQETSENSQALLTYQAFIPNNRIRGYRVTSGSMVWGKCGWL